MNTDIRIDIRLPHHWKYRKLKRLIGCAPMEHLVLFWTTVAEQIPNGQLEGWDADDIEAAAEWGGEPGVFFSAMLKCEFIDKADGCYSPHDWAEHQPWAVGAEERSTNSRKAAQTRWDGVSKGDKSAAAQKAAQARWGKKSTKPADSNAECMPDACGMHADSNAECMPSRGDAPSPLPKPKPLKPTTATNAREQLAVAIAENLPKLERLFPNINLPVAVEKLLAKHHDGPPLIDPYLTALKWLQAEFPPSNKPSRASPDPSPLNVKISGDATYWSEGVTTT